MDLFFKYFKISIPFVVISNLFSFNFITEGKYRKLIRNTRFYRTVIECNKFEVTSDRCNYLISGWIKPGDKIIVCNREHVEVSSSIYYGLPRPDVGRVKGNSFQNSGFMICIPGEYSLKDLHFLIIDQDGNLQGKPYLATENLAIAFEVKSECAKCTILNKNETSFIDAISRFFLPTSSENYLKFFVINFCSIQIPFDYEILLLNSKIFNLLDMNFFQTLFGQTGSIQHNLIFASFSHSESFNENLRYQLNRNTNSKFIELSYSKRSGFEKSYEFHENFKTYNQIKWTENGLLWPNLTSHLDVSLYAGLSNRLIPDYKKSNITGFFLGENHFREIDECVLTPSVVIDNFFHFFIEVLIPLCENTDRNLFSVPLLLPNNIHNNQIDLLKYLGYNNHLFCKPNDLISIKKCHLVYRDNYLVDALESNINSYSINTREILNLREALLSGMPSNNDLISKNKRLALMRGTGRRSLINSDEVESKLVDQGFEIIRPEEHSLESLSGKIREAESIFLTGGAAMANLIFARPGTNILYLTSEQLRDYSLPKFYANIFDLNFQQLLGYSKSPSSFNNPYDYFHGSFIFDSKILDTL